MGNVMKSGRLTWYLQRYSALYFILFLAYLEYTFWTSGITFQFLTSDNLFKASLSIFILLACAHAYIGLWTVGTDYLTKRTLGFLNKSVATNANIIRNAYYFLFVVMGILYLIAILYIIWL